MNKDDNRLLETARKFDFTGIYKDLFFRIKSCKEADIQQLKDDIWALTPELQTSLIRELAKVKGII